MKGDKVDQGQVGRVPVDGISSPPRYGTLLSLCLGLLIVVLVTGVYSRLRFTLSPLDQWIFLGHILLGLIFPAVFVAYLAYHLHIVFKSRNLRQEWGSHLLGIGTSVAIGVALWSGIVLTFYGAPHTNADWSARHRIASWVTIGVLPVHMVWAFWRRFLTGRGASLSLWSRVFCPIAIAMALGAGLSFVGIIDRPVATEIPVPDDYFYVPTKDGSREPFYPGLARTQSGSFIPVDNLSGSAQCASCHREIYDQWKSSTHRFAASNDHYLAQVKLRIHDVPVKPHLGARFCANCHEPIALFAGEIDPKGRGIEIPENRDEGLSCLSCHRIQQLHTGTIGNANMVMAPHEPYLFQTSQDESLRSLGNLVLRSKPGIHKEQLMKSFYRTSEYCATCHKFSIDEAINGHGFFRLQNTFDEWKNSSYGDPKSPNFKRCQDCHMPLVPSEDPAAKPYMDGGRIVRKIRDHRFLGSNSMRPFLDGDEKQLAATQEFLKDKIVLQIQSPESLEAVRPNRFRVAVFNDGVGHRFPTGTTDVHDCWIEFRATDASGAVLFESGTLDSAGYLDPGAHRFVARAVDETGAWLFRRDMWNLAGFEYVNTIFPKNFSMASFEVPVPVGHSGEIQVTAKLLFRKSNQKFTDFVFSRAPFRNGSGFQGVHEPGIRLPVTTLAADSRVIKMGPSDSSIRTGPDDRPAGRTDPLAALKAPLEPIPASPTDLKVYSTLDLRSGKDGSTGEIFYADVTSSSGVEFTHRQRSGPQLRYLPETMGSGCGVVDYDGDGHLDVFFVQGMGDLSSDERPTMRLYRGRGDATFTDVTDSVGLAVGLWGMGCLWFDHNNDGRPDLLVSAYGESNRLFRQKKDHTFEDVTVESGLYDPENKWSTGLTALDFDGDGDLDVYVCSYLDFAAKDFVPDPRLETIYNSGLNQPATFSPFSYEALPNHLYRNNGDGTFTDVTESAGVEGAHGKSLSALAADLDGDGWTDLFVANDVSPKNLYRNNGDGTFEDIAQKAWVADIRGSMGLASGDIDGDGALDVFSTHWISEPNALYMNNFRRANNKQTKAMPGRRLTFSEISEFSGLGGPSTAMVGWGCRLMDVNLDGLLDILLVNGHTFLDEGKEPRHLIAMSGMIFRNSGAKRFASVSLAAGDGLAVPRVSRGLAAGDLDEDGVPDLIVTTNNGPAVVLRHRGPDGCHWLGINLKGTLSSPDPIGSTVTLTTDLGSQTQARVSGDSYLSSNAGTLFFGLGTQVLVRSVRVQWPAGQTETYKVGSVDRVLTLVEGQGS